MRDLTSCNRWPALIGLVTLSWLYVTVQFWIHHKYQGNHWAGFGIGKVSKPLERIGVSRNDNYGTDGQFYLMVAADPFARETDQRSLDDAVYRYQRVGIPLLGYLLYRCLGFRFSLAHSYYLVQIVLLTVAAIVFGKFLLERGVSPSFAMLLPLHFGVLWALLHGFVDPGADALFTISLVSFVNRKLPSFIVWSSLLALSREGYVIWIASVFLMTLRGKVMWGRGREALVSAVGLLFPVVICGLWRIYLTCRFSKGVGILENITDHGLAMIGPPFVGIWEGLTNLPSWSPWATSIRIASIVLLIVIGLRMARFAVYDKVVLSLMPFLGLTICLSWRLWRFESGAAKTLTSFLVIALYLETRRRSLELQRVIAGFLCFSIICSLGWLWQNRGAHVPERGTFEAGLVDVSVPPILNQIVRPVNETSVAIEVQGPLRAKIFKQVLPVEIEIENLSNYPMEFVFGMSPHPVIFYHIRYAPMGPVAWSGFAGELTSRIAENQKRIQTAYFPIPRVGTYFVTFSVQRSDVMLDGNQGFPSTPMRVEVRG